MITWRDSSSVNVHVSKEAIYKRKSDLPTVVLFVHCSINPILSRIYCPSEFQMAPKYKLTYFNSRGIAEYIRLIFVYAEVEYEDIRIEKEQWPELKSKQPFGKLPVLEVEGKVLAESLAISRYLAKEFGLAGKNNWEAAQADMILDALRDTFSGRKKFMLEEDEAKKEEMKKVFFTETLPPYLNSVEKILKENGGTYLVGKSTTYVDIGIAYTLHELQNHIPQLLDKYEGLKGLIERIFSVPAIKKWVETRPKTQF